ncbi:bifunctional 2-polyprenyl-6-hydroxyphenol methylase/3-demethylubiquinol 3-O-methyltransferase UbiG [Kineosporia sp. A_224]|uniref:class I SAM-dependent methyltransferase n=1 Tax=Kineosporia sp. A_224 TaxID=1962180 RepID=UPI000B4B2BEF|nr:class I SAM-dependent methyltransferase [Kineosporia sp. A_224]
MPVNFHDPAQARTYSDRDADPTWTEAFGRLVDPRGLRAVDLGCGGGTYSRALLRLGAAHVVGVDSSAPILDAARADAPAGLDLVRADVTATGLPDGAAGLVLSRAVVHHLPDLDAFAREAYRLLVPGGHLVVQDRTPDDVDRPAGPDNLRGYLLAAFPRLRAVEAGRRPDAAALTEVLRRNGFDPVTTSSLHEVRRVHASAEAYATELRARTGRSILHELDDTELDGFCATLRATLPPGPVVERDRWTLWHTVRPADPQRPPAVPR